MNRSRNGESRRITLWEEKNYLTQTQSFIKDKIEEHYAQRHPKLSDCGEAELINSFIPPKCPFCASAKFRKYGLTANGVQRYRWALTHFLVLRVDVVTI